MNCLKFNSTLNDPKMEICRKTNQPNIIISPMEIKFEVIYTQI